jgi:hypothetical protein
MMQIADVEEFTTKLIGVPTARFGAMKTLPDEILIQLATMVAEQAIHPYLWGVRPPGMPERTINLRWCIREPGRILIHPVRSNERPWVSWRTATNLLEGAKAELWNRSDAYGDIPFIRVKGRYEDVPVTIDILSQPSRT